MSDRRLPKEIELSIDRSLAKPTRIHKVATPSASQLWIKREDELSSGISGGKVRKYASLIPYLKQNGIDLVGMIGGPNSNNLVGLAQLLKENQISPFAFVREAAAPNIHGNALLLAMLLSEEERMLIPRDKWDAVEKIASEVLQQRESRGQHTHLLREGCFGVPALLGSLTLAEDILRNESELGRAFDRIYIDCGTGLSAIGLVLGLQMLLGEAAIEREIVITLIAETEARFLEKLNSIKMQLHALYPIAAYKQANLRFLKPVLSPRFGSVNKSLFQSCCNVARESGMLMDPTYSAKHFATALQDQASAKAPLLSLFVFNGSALGLMGFQDQIARSSMEGI
ncbi:pyridoxal-phosphate dependent enzyme [Pelagicoccus sp. NFK12]|uniref:Pyridoxal-phosphate dependent enzyme n=1 Tax=Pelagicoccus enzymogenes TaxID=2773457 RepID=A0A927F8G7_9BACT|nr:pyridoxal-phosphate dependent enzyme [Pelagicoccus enzymogenes]MBD5780232.1 pyridoxal-phosphate dependent enzyme [Pelagicoccus enzymogenes]